MSINLHYRQTLLLAYVFFIFSILTLASCSKDEEIFSDTIQKSIDENSNGINIGESGNRESGDNEIIIDNSISTDLKAFPSAEGAGALTTGGRGGKILHVTKLTDDGSEGTLRWAMMQDYPRIIVFDVSGTIRLNGSFGTGGTTPDNMTIASQTAPYGGITIESSKIGFWRVNNVIVRYLRFVNVNILTNEFSGKLPVFNLSGANDIIIDHCSFRYSPNSVAIAAQDDADTSDGQGNITVQRCLMAECATGMLIGAAAGEGYRNRLGGENSVHHNLFAHISHRFPNVGGGTTLSESVNNVVYNFKWRLNTYFPGTRNNVIGNYYKGGPSSSWMQGAKHKIGDYLDNSDNIQKIFLSDNIVNFGSNSISKGEDNWNQMVILWTDDSAANPNIYQADSPFTFSNGVPITINDPEIAYNSVLQNVGANVSLNQNGSKIFYLDEVDQGYINDVLNKTYTLSPDGLFINKTDSSLLKYPELPTNQRPDNYDTDKDGMPDVWEIANGFNPEIDDSAQDADGDGYTNIEEFLNLVDL